MPETDSATQHRDNIIRRQAQDTRFKGLGEISPKEFAPIFNSYMGKNRPERKDYIMDKLVVPVEE